MSNSPATMTVDVTWKLEDARIWAKLVMWEHALLAQRMPRVQKWSRAARQPVPL